MDTYFKIYGKFMAFLFMSPDRDIFLCNFLLVNHDQGAGKSAVLNSLIGHAVLVSGCLFNLLPHVGALLLLYDLLPKSC